MNAGAAASSWSDERDLRPGHVLGPFELIGLVGRGGMARVWAAREQRSGTLYALKMLRAHLAENADFRNMFFDEARIASRIKHENVAQTFELLELDGVLTLVMELVDGPSLVRILRPGFSENEAARRIALPPRVAAYIVAETCAGLHAAHELRDDNGRPLGVVHRDVSPHNVLITGDGRVKITDFGIAKAFGKSHQTLAGHIKGKLAYMSPEQLHGGGTGVDRRSDVFAIGCLLYELTAGQRAFDGDNDPDVMRAILEGNPLPPSRVVPGYPVALDQIVMTALAPTAEARWPSARAMQDALEAFLAASGPPVGPADVAAILNERMGAPPSAKAVRRAPPAPHLPTIESGTRRREEQSTSWVLYAFAMVVGLALGLVVLRSVYIARKTSAATTTPVPRIRPSPSASASAGAAASATASAASAIRAVPDLVPTKTWGPDGGVAPALSTPVAKPALAPAAPVAAPAAPAAPRPRPAGTSSGPAVPPNPYD